MNYSNHLTNDEVTFLKNIHSLFKENNKFYSLFITVNRIDERYAVNEEKSVDRILDYISTRLEDLKPPYKRAHCKVFIWMASLIWLKPTAQITARTLTHCHLSTPIPFARSNGLKKIH